MVGDLVRSVLVKLIVKQRNRIVRGSWRGKNRPERTYTHDDYGVKV